MVWTQLMIPHQCGHTVLMVQPEPAAKVLPQCIPILKSKVVVTVIFLYKSFMSFSITVHMLSRSHSYYGLENCLCVCVCVCVCAL